MRVAEAPRRSSPRMAGIGAFDDARTRVTVRVTRDGARWTWLGGPIVGAVMIARERAAMAVGMSLLVGGCACALPHDQSDASGALDAWLDAGQEGGTEPMVSLGVDCGTVRCIADEVCVVDCSGGAPLPIGCVPRDREPGPVHGTAPPWSCMTLACRADSDCVEGRRCVAIRGEIERFVCTDEGDDCPLHVGHVCETDADCHECPSGGATVGCRRRALDPTLQLCGF